MNMDITEIQELIKRRGIVFLSYGGFLSQALISGMADALEKEAEHSELGMKDSINLFTVFIELGQNMMNYAASQGQSSKEALAGGLIFVSKDVNGDYYIDSQNLLSLKDKEKIEPRLTEVQSLDKAGIRKRYRELRRTGENTHERGGGIGFYEIARRCNTIGYEFHKVSEDRFIFHIKTHFIMNK